MIVIRLGNIMLEQKTEASEMGGYIYDQEYLNFVSMVIVTLAHTLHHPPTAPCILKVTTFFLVSSLEFVMEYYYKSTIKV